MSCCVPAASRPSPRSREMIDRFPTIRLLLRSGRNDLAHWTGGTDWPGVPFGTSGSGIASRTSSTGIALRTGRSDRTSIALGSNRACVSLRTSRAGRSSITLRPDWSGIPFGASGSNWSGAPSRSHWPGFANWSGGPNCAGIALWAGWSGISLRTGRPGKQLHCLDLRRLGSAKGVHNRAAADAVPDQQQDEENQGSDETRQHSADPPLAIHDHSPVWSKPVTTRLPMHISLLSDPPQRAGSSCDAMHGRNAEWVRGVLVPAARIELATH